MKLEVNHLAAYLPYNLECLIKEKESYYIGIMGSVYTGGSCTFHNIVESEQGFDNISPILNPITNISLEDVAKIQEFIGLGKWCEAYDEYLDILFDDFANIEKIILQAPLSIFQYFLSNHYDVFGLIEKRLAIPKR